MQEGKTRMEFQEQRDNIEIMKQWIQESKKIVFFGGAGVSTESHIPDFRSVDGIYMQEYDYRPETILSHTFYKKIQKNFTVFTEIKCYFQMQSRTKHIWRWRNWNRKGS